MQPNKGRISQPERPSADFAFPWFRAEPFHLVHQLLHRRAFDLNQEAVKNGSQTPRRLPAPLKREQPKEGLHKDPCPSRCLQSHSYVVALWYRTCASAFYGHCATPG